MATDLATLFSNTQGEDRRLIETRDFYPDQPNPYLAEELQASSEDLASFFFLGHTDNKTFGDFSVEEFAIHFDQAFEDGKKKLLQNKKPFKYEDKAKVKAVHIFGCQAGLANMGKNDSYAQRLANALYDRGFVNAKVHAVAYEKQAPDESMYVEVIWEPGPLRDKETQHGFISAHSLDEKTVSEVRLLRHVQEQAQNEASKELAESKIKHHYSVAKARRKPLADAVSPLPFLMQAENTFVAKESYRQRKLRILHDPEYIEREKRKRVIELLTPIKDQTQDQDKKNILLRLLRDLKANFVSSCDQICTAYKNEYKKLITIFGYTPQSKTLDLLEQLSQGKITSQPSTRLEVELEMTGIDSEEEEEKRSLLSPRRRSGLFPAASSQQEEKGLGYFMREIDSLYEQLENEISLLQDRVERSCFAYFLSYEINTKAQKRDCLQELKKATSLGELQEKAKTALDDSRVKRGFRNTCTKEWWKSRTSMLLNEIIKGSQLEAKLLQCLK